MTSDTDTHLYNGTPEQSVPTQETPSTTETSTTETSTAETAKSEAQNVASTAVESGGQVLETAKSETSDLVSHAGQSARELFDQARVEFTDQAGTQQHRVAGGLRELAEELERMGQGSSESGLAGSLVKQASERTRTAAEWIGEREPGDLFTEVKHYAARKPGTFLAAAAALGFLGARLTRGLMAGDSSSTASPRPGVTTAPASVTGEGFATEVTPVAAPAYHYEDTVPTVTTISHGEPVTYPSATGGSATGSLSTAAPAPFDPITDDGTQGPA